MNDEELIGKVHFVMHCYGMNIAISLALAGD